MPQGSRNKQRQVQSCPVKSVSLTHLKKDCAGRSPCENGAGKAREAGVSEGDTPMERNEACGVCSRAMPEKAFFEMRSYQG